MKTLPRWVALVAMLTTALVALPPAFAKDIMDRVIGTQTTAIRREASEYQRKVAEANARAYMAAKLGAQHHTAAAPGKKKPKDDPQTVAIKKTLPRYIAVDTPMDKRSAPGTKKDVMIFDTQSENLVNNSVYDVASPPLPGTTAKFDTYSAQYVAKGEGL